MTGATGRDVEAALVDGPGWPAPVLPALDPPRPLEGVRVLDLSRVLAGPYCCTVLADLGADVVKVERPGVGDDTRHWGPPFHGDDAAYFLSVNRDRRSVAVDLASASGAAVVRRLVGTADVVVENFLPRHLRALGLEQLRDQAGTVWVSVRGAGGDGPDGEEPGYDVMAQARSGLMSVTGTDVPTKVGVAVVDVVAGLYAAVGAVAGLVTRGQGGRAPLRVEVGLLESAVSLLVNQAGNALVGGVVPGLGGNEHPNIVPYGPVACADHPLVVGAGNDAQFAALCAAVGLAPEAGWRTNAGRVADRVALVAALTGVLRARTAQEWSGVLAAAGVPCAPVQDLAAMQSDPQVVATGLLQTLDHPAGRVRVVGSPYRLDGVRPRPRQAPPLLGQHTTQVLTALGLSPVQVHEVTGTASAPPAVPASHAEAPFTDPRQGAGSRSSGGEVLVAALRTLGVEVAFGLPGVHNLPAWKAFGGRPGQDPGVRLVGVRHEQTAGYAADGYARATGRLGVAITTTGPGASNVVTAVGEAWSCHTPLLVIATDIPTSLRRPGAYRGVLHETTDQASFFRPVTKAQFRVDDVARLDAVLQAAGRAAMQHPRGPVYVEVPTDVLSAVVTAEPPAPPGSGGPGSSGLPAPPVVEVDTGALAEAVALLTRAQRPLLWVGGGATASGAGAAVGELALALGAPVLSSYGGRGLLAPDHPCSVPLPPHVPEVGALWDRADCVLVLGSDLDAMNTQGFRQPRPASLVVVDLAVLANADPDVHLVGDVQSVVTGLLEALPGPGRTPWWSWAAVTEDGRAALAAAFPAETGFLSALEAALPEQAVVVADMCVAGYWYGGFGRVARPRGLAYPVGWGTLGFGFPAALGTSLSGRPTVAVVGDGGFLFACGDLATAAQERLPVTVVLVDDGGYGMLRYDFTVHGEAPVGTELEPPDFVALARAFRVDAVEVGVDALTAAVTAGIASGRPNLVVVKTTLSPPPTTSPNWYRAAPVS